MKLTVVTSALIGLILTLASCQDAQAGSSDATVTTALTTEVLSNLNQGQLDAIFHAAQPGPIPNGDAQGTAVWFAGSDIEKPLQKLSEIVWQGKVFDTEPGESFEINKILEFRAIISENYYGEAFYDGLPAVILDYSHSSIIGNRFRDEIRLVSPGVYLGRWYVRDFLNLVEVFICNFVLDFTEEGMLKFVKSQHPANAGAVSRSTLRWATRDKVMEGNEGVEEDETRAGENFF